MVPVSSAIGIKVSGKSRPRFVPPARKHLEAERLGCVEGDERLIIGNELARGDSAFDLGLKLDSLLQFFVHAAIEETVATAAFGLRPIHSHGSLAQRGFDPGAVPLRHRITHAVIGRGGGDTDARAHLKRQ